MQSGEPKFLNAAERNYRTIMDNYGQFPGGGFAADENCRPGYVDPRQGFETCSWVEFMHSFEMLTKISGNPLWADRCEEIAFNSLPAAMTPDLKGLHYLTGANQVATATRLDKSPGIQNGGAMFIYSPWEFRCCQHNVSHGWPYYAEELWLATADGGLCASLYAASEVTAKVGPGEGTTVPDRRDHRLSLQRHHRLEADHAQGRAVPALLARFRAGASSRPSRSTASGGGLGAKPHSFIRIERDWNSGDAVALRLAHGRQRANLAEEQERRFGGLRPADLLA